MRLVDDWQWVFAKAWSIRLSLLSVLLQGAVFVVPMVQPPHPSLTFVVIAGALQIGAGLAALAAAGARIVSQPEIKNGPG